MEVLSFFQFPLEMSIVFTMVLAVLGALPIEHELKPKEESERWRMLEVISSFEAAANDGRSLGQLNASEISGIEAAIAGQRDHAATWAQNILCFHYGLCRAPLTGGDDGAPKARRRVVVEDERDLGPSLGIQPNPADGWTTFVVDLAHEPQHAALVIHDLPGRVVRQIQLSSPKQELLLDTRGLISGTYTVQLVNDNVVIRTEKLVIRQ